MMKNGEVKKFRKGKIFVLSAPSGAGKTTLINMIKQEFSFLEESVSCTTRAPREGEVDGVDYFFMSKEEFEQKKNQNYFLEWAKVHDHYYGTPKDFVKQRIKDGAWLICDIDVQGAINIKRHFPKEAVLIFVVPPSMDELENRLKKRALDKDEVIKQRLENARDELSHFKHYRYIIVNDNINHAAALLRNILNAEINASISRNIDIIKKFF